MMRVINLAHGEFMMLGGYATITAVNLGVNVFVAMLIVVPVIVGLIGLVVERLMIRRLYGRLVDTMLATWGLSLFFIGGVIAAVAMLALPLLLGGTYTLTVLVIYGMLGLSLGLVWGFGGIAVGIRENETRMSLMGYDVQARKTVLFTIGAAIAGLAGALFANWGEIVTPRLFSLGQSAEIIIWCIVGGLGTRMGPILGAAGHCALMAESIGTMLRFASMTRSLRTHA